MGVIRFTHQKAIGNTSKQTTDSLALEIYPQISQMRQIEHALNMLVQGVLGLGMGKSA